MQQHGAQPDGVELLRAQADRGSVAAKHETGAPRPLGHGMGPVDPDRQPVGGRLAEVAEVGTGPTPEIEDALTGSGAEKLSLSCRGTGPLPFHPLHQRVRLGGLIDIVERPHLHVRHAATVRPGQDVTVIRPIRDEDFDWAASLMERRRGEMLELSPVFWRPATGITARHAEFMRATAARDGAVAVRSRSGFALSFPHADRCVIDDFAVDDDDLWADEGRELLLGVWAAARSPRQPVLRVVTARRDQPKRSMLISLDLKVAARWWVKELVATGDASTWGPATVAGVDALIGPAPPVYDPGGPVCLLGDVDPGRAGPAADAAAGLGAVLAIVQLETDLEESEPALEAAGFHNPSEFYEGNPTTAIAGT